MLDFTYDQLKVQFARLANLVSPEALRREFSSFVLDTGKPLAPGLRSFAKVEKGIMTYTEAPAYTPGVVGTIVHITDGSVVRAVGGGIIAMAKFSFHHQTMNTFSNALGVDAVEWVTPDESLSCDPSNPTVFVQQREISVREGTEVPDFSIAGHTTPTPVSVTAPVAAEVAGYMSGNKFIGKIVAQSYFAAANVDIRVCANIELLLR